VGDLNKECSVSSGHLGLDLHQVYQK